MMKTNIEAIFFDVGSTLRVIVKDREFMAQARKDLMTLVGAREPEGAFFEMLEARRSDYRKHSKATLVELPERELWTQWLLPDYPPEKIALHSAELTRLYREHDGRRIGRPGVNEVVKELHRRGYRLGIIANTITEAEVPTWLEVEGLTEYFEAVVLSSKVGPRKPRPEIFWEAARRMGVQPSHCAYVGDNPVVDLGGCRAAGFRMMIIFHEPATLAKGHFTGDSEAESTIQSFHELLDIFPLRPGTLTQL